VICELRDSIGLLQTIFKPELDPKKESFHSERTKYIAELEAKLARINNRAKHLHSVVVEERTAIDELRQKHLSGQVVPKDFVPKDFESQMPPTLQIPPPHSLTELEEKCEPVSIRDFDYYLPPPFREQLRTLAVPTQSPQSRASAVSPTNPLTRRNSLQSSFPGFDMNLEEPPNQFPYPNCEVFLDVLSARDLPAKTMRSVACKIIVVSCAPPPPPPHNPLLFCCIILYVLFLFQIYFFLVFLHAACA
jgi:hypothetical protein